jgi:arginase
MARIVVLGAGFNSAGRRDGVARAPQALRRAGLIAAASARPGTGPSARHDVRDAGDVAFGEPLPVRGEAGLLAEQALASMVAAVRRGVETILADGAFPLLVGGDCPVLLGALAACRDVHGSAGLLFVDGHEDAWPPAASPTGEAADCELGLALGLTDTGLLPEPAPLLRPEATALLGPRDAAELMEHGVRSLRGTLWFASDRELTGRIADSVAGAAASVERSAARWWLHVDLDVLATDQLAAVDYPQPGGLTWAELTDLTALALGRPACAGWSLAIYNPDLDEDRHQAARIVRYVEESLSPVTLA